ncbi:MAG: mechanosensitive ion channel [Myxococcales bacterium]|nr:MAG: mechanosensitive ion channel [Myxococcales bacterium]
MSIHRLWCLCQVWLSLTLCSLSGLAAPAESPASSSQAPAGAPPAENAEEDKGAPDSPRASIAEFRRLTRAGDYEGAARYLDLSQVDTAEGPTLARHLKEVLNRRPWLDPAKLSPESRGNTTDNLIDKDELGTIRGASGNYEPVVLVRKTYRPGSHWVFSSDTVAQIEGWYEHLENIWLIDHLPKPLLKMGPKLLRWWQWIALVPLLISAWMVSYVVTRLGRFLATRALSEQHGNAAHQLHGPVTLAVTVGVTYAALPWLGLYQPAHAFLERWCSAFLLIALFWALWRGVELSRRTVSSSRWANESVSAKSLLSLGSRLAKFAVGAAAFVMVLSQLGYQATTILTGLGIGGVALALAAQKTVENLFGAFSLAVDQPFREGDYIKVDGIEGTVEALGLRSTRIRSPDRTVISLPNGKLADMRVETVSRQDRYRFYLPLGLAHAASAQVEQVLARIKELLSSQELVAKETIAVRFVALTDSSLNIEAVAMLDTAEVGKFLDAKERLLLGILKIVEEAGVPLAHPVRTVELATSKGGAPPPELPQDSEPDSAPRLSKTG